MKITRALISVSDKTGIAEFAAALQKWNVEILSTGGTAKRLRDKGVPVVEVSAYTGSPEILGGRVKTLHPKIHGGLLYVRGNPTHEKEREANAIGPIDLVVVNLYPFEQTVAKENVSTEEAIENIDIGGPSMIRSAAKNHAAVAVLTDPAQYDAVLAELKEHDGALNDETRRRLAMDAFARTALYDSAIHSYLHGVTTPDEMPEQLTVPLRKVQSLRYGENPHQRAAFYERLDHRGPSLALARQLNGKELSFNNILDLDAAYQMVAAFAEPFCAVIKHGNPCGAAVGHDLPDAFAKAHAIDPLSAFGSIVGVNHHLDVATATAMAELIFIEAIVAPSVEPAALDILTAKPKWKKNVRILELPGLGDGAAMQSMEIRDVAGGVLLQERDRFVRGRDDWTVPTKKQPTDAQWASLQFAWRMCRFVKSNTIVLANGLELVGVGAGQMSRVDSAEIATRKAGERMKGSVVASDALIPFPDVIETTARAGATAVIQPGGSKGDAAVIASCDTLGIPMVFTGERHFRH